MSLLVVASLTIVAWGGGSGKASNTTNSTATSTTAAATATTVASTTTVPQSPLLAGNAHPQYPQGAPHELSVVYQAPISESQGGDVIVPIVFRNNTSKPSRTLTSRPRHVTPVGKSLGQGTVGESYLRTFCLANGPTPTYTTAMERPLNPVIP